MLSPALCGSSKAVEVTDSSRPTMKSASSVEKLCSPPDSRVGDFASRVKNLFTSSPLRKRKSMSLSSLPHSSSSTSLVFGVPLVDLVTREGKNVPNIVQRIVEHVEEEGLDQEGIYRVNGNAKVIESLKCSFDKVGSADFTDLDIAAVAGLLKLFLREIPSSIIPDDMVPKFVEIQHAHPGHASPEALDLLRETIGQLPNTNYTLLKYLMKHLAKVVQHSAKNKMSPVSLSIVFGPNIFRCGSGLEGLKQQGFTNPVVCRMIQHYTTLFEPAPHSPSQNVNLRRGDRKRPSRPKPYADHLQEKKVKENLSSPPPSAIPPNVSFQMEGEEEYSERSVDEAIERSSGTLSPTSPTPLQNEDPRRDASPRCQVSSLVKSSSNPEYLFVESYKEEEEEAKTFQRQYAKRGMKYTPRSPEKARSRGESNSGVGKSKDSNAAVAKSPSEPVEKQPVLKHPQISALNPHEDPELTMRTPSPYSWQSSPGTSPPTSPVLTPRSSRQISSVIEDSVKQFLFEPTSPSKRLPRQPDSLQPHGRGNDSKVTRTGMYGLLLPDKADSPRAKRKSQKQDSGDAEPGQSHDVVQTNAPGQMNGPGTKAPTSGSGQLHQAAAAVDSDLSATNKRRVKIVAKSVEVKRTKGDGNDECNQKLDQDNVEGDHDVVVQRHTQNGRSADKPSQLAVVRRRGKRERDALKLRNRKSALHGEEGTNVSMEDMDVQIVSVSSRHSGTDEEILSRKGKVSDLVHQFEETDSGVVGRGREEEQEGRGGGDRGAPRGKKRPGLKAFKMFESSGVIMGMAPPSRAKGTVSSEPDTAGAPQLQTVSGSENLTTVTRAHLSTSISDEDAFASPKHTLTTDGSTAGSSSHNGRKLQLPSTVSDDVFVSVQPATAVEREKDKEKKKEEADFKEFDAVTSSGTLQHLTLGRPRGPLQRKPRRAISTPVATVTEAAIKEELRKGEDDWGSGVAHKRLTRAHSTPVATTTADSLAERVEQREQATPDELPERKGERANQREHRKKVTVDGGRPKEKRQDSESLPTKPGPPKVPTKPSSAAPRVHLLDLTALAPENQPAEVRQGWEDGTRGKDRAAPASPQQTTSIATAKELSHRIHELKTATREFEADFVAKYGHKPSGGERSPVRPQLEELSKLRKSLRALKERSASEEKLNQTAPPELPTAGTPTGSTERLARMAKEATSEDLSPRGARKSKEIHPELSVNGVLSPSGNSVASLPPSSVSSLQATLEQVMVLLEEKRKTEGRPENLKLMSADQVMAEKHSIQKTLLQFEKKYGRPKTTQDKDTMRPLYDRYRLVKKFVAKTKQDSTLSATTDISGLEVTTGTLASVTLLQHGLTQSLPLEASPEQENHTRTLKTSHESVDGGSTSVDRGRVTAPDSNMRIGDGSDMMSDRQLSDTSLNELHKQHDLAMAVKKHLRKVLKEYEHGFMAMHGRAVAREDRKPMQKEYREYRNIKARLKLIETLISKLDPSKTL